MDFCHEFFFFNRFTQIPLPPPTPKHTQMFKSFEFGNGSRISDKKLVILEFKYLQNKKNASKQAVKSTRIKKSYRT